MHYLIPATHVTAFTSFARATSKARRKATLFLFSVAVLLAGSAAAVRGQSAFDGFDLNANGTVSVVVVQPDGKILIGGDFASVGGQAYNRIARLDPTTGLADSSNPNASNAAHSIAVPTDSTPLQAVTIN